MNSRIVVIICLLLACLCLSSHVAQAGPDSAASVSWILGCQVHIAVPSSLYSLTLHSSLLDSNSELQLWWQSGLEHLKAEQDWAAAGSWEMVFMIVKGEWGPLHFGGSAALWQAPEALWEMGMGHFRVSFLTLGFCLLGVGGWGGRERRWGPWSSRPRPYSP